MLSEIDSVRIELNSWDTQLVSKHCPLHRFGNPIYWYKRKLQKPLLTVEYAHTHLHFSFRSTNKGMKGFKGYFHRMIGIMISSFFLLNS